MKYPLVIKKNAKGSLLVYTENEAVQESRGPFAYLNDLCLKHGSSYSGRTASFRQLTGAVQKPCVLISERTQKIYMPLLSEKNPDNIWLLYNTVVSVRKTENGCKVLFSDGTMREFGFDPRVIRLQMKRCHEFLNQINDPKTF